VRAVLLEVVTPAGQVVAHQAQTIHLVQAQQVKVIEVALVLVMLELLLLALVVVVARGQLEGTQLVQTQVVLGALVQQVLLAAVV
jgi:hypothetical protein